MRQVVLSFMVLTAVFVSKSWAGTNVNPNDLYKIYEQSFSTEADYRATVRDCALATSDLFVQLDKDGYVLRNLINEMASDDLADQALLKILMDIKNNRIERLPRKTEANTSANFLLSGFAKGDREKKVEPTLYLKGNKIPSLFRDEFIDLTYSSALCQHQLQYEKFDSVVTVYEQADFLIHAYERARFRTLQIKKYEELIPQFNQTIRLLQGFMGVSSVAKIIEVEKKAMK